MKPCEKAILTVKTKSLGSGRQCDDLKVGELGNHAAMWAVPILVNTISGKLLVDVKNLSELYSEIVRMQGNGSQQLGHHSFTKHQ